MRRRDLISFAAAGAAVLPISLQRAPLAGPLQPLIGLLDASAATAAKLNGFYEGLNIEGFVRNRNVAVEYHSAQGDYARLPALAADLIDRGVTLIASVGSPAALAAKSATKAIPIVFAVESDPVQLGLVASLNWPGGNVTGVTNVDAEVTGERFRLLHEVLSLGTTVGLLVNPNNPNAERQTIDAQAMAGKLELQVHVLHADKESDFPRAFAMLGELRGGGLVIGADGFLLSRSEQLAALALSHAVAVIFASREFAAAGGLMSYGNSLAQFYHQTGVYCGLILKGAHAADLPVFQSTKIELILNLRTAKLLGLKFSSALLDRATEVIE